MGVRGRLRPSPRLRLSPTTATTDLATGPTATPLTATATDLSMARGRLRPSPRLRLSPTTTVDTDLATMDLATGATATVTAMDLSTARGRLRPSPRLGRALLRLLRTWLPRTWLQGLRLRLRPRTCLRQEEAEAKADPYYYGGYGYGHGLGYGYGGYGLGYRTTGDKLLQALQDLNHR